MKRFPILRSRRQAGDTIVEVMIVLSILALAFAISYSIATRGLTQSRNAEEHSEALGLLDTQVELMRSAMAKNATIPVGTTPPAGNTSLNFCMSDAHDPADVVGFGSYTVPSNPATDAAIDNVPPAAVYPAACVSSFYHMNVVYDSAAGVYDFRVRWDGLGSLGRQQEEFTYKITPIAANFGGAPYTPNPILQTPTIQVSVKKIQKNGNNTAPLCSSGNARTNLSGTAVTLSPGSQSGITGSTGIASITDLVDGQAYTATTSSSGYTFCSSTSASATTTPPFNQITVVVAAQCVTHPASTGPPYNHYTTAYVWVHTGPDNYYDWRNMPPVQGSPPAFFDQYEYSGGTNNPSQPVYLTQYNLQFVLSPPAYIDTYAYYWRYEYHPYQVYLGFYGDPVPAFNTCT